MYCVHFLVGESKFLLSCDVPHLFDSDIAYTDRIEH